MDPLEIARIQAQGRMGGDIAKVEMDLAARRAAIEEFRRITAIIDQLEPGDPRIEILERERLQMMNVIQGFRLSDPRQSELG